MRLPQLLLKESDPSMRAGAQISQKTHKEADQALLEPIASVMEGVEAG